jgi:hypothetical protein
MWSSNMSIHCTLFRHHNSPPHPTHITKTSHPPTTPTSTSTSTSYSTPTYIRRLHIRTAYTYAPPTHTHRLHIRTAYTYAPPTHTHRLHIRTIYTYAPSTHTHRLHIRTAYTYAPSTHTHCLRNHSTLTTPRSKWREWVKETFFHDENIFENWKKFDNFYSEQPYTKNTVGILREVAWQGIT